VENTVGNVMRCCAHGPPGQPLVAAAAKLGAGKTMRFKDLHEAAVRPRAMLRSRPGPGEAVEFRRCGGLGHARG